tara:strand:- start:251 stop:484 length:234 start_codon:yes stop_codon:yes gene_type:complete
MSSKLNKKELTPFEKAKINIKKFAENANIMESTRMLVLAASKIEHMSESEKEVFEKLFQTTLEDLSSFMEESGFEWN